MARAALTFDAFCDVVLDVARTQYPDVMVVEALKQLTAPIDV